VPGPYFVASGFFAWGYQKRRYECAAGGALRRRLACLFSFAAGIILIGARGMRKRPNLAHALDAGLRLFLSRAPLARASDAQRSTN
jgi:hypothetical protein